MIARSCRVLPLCAAGLLALPAGALAHAVCGPRVFPVTLTMDDPGVSDELSLPTVTYQHSGQNTGSPGDLTTVNLEYDKRITENFGVSFNDQWDHLASPNSASQQGWEDLLFTAKYQDCISPEHEFIMSVGVQQEIGSSGDTNTFADKYGSTAPTVYFGKGMGDLPIGPLRALAVTGELSYAWADRSLKVSSMTDPISSNVTTATNNGNGNAWFGGISLQYSIPYLQSQVKDYGLPPLFAHMIPTVEFTWVSPGTRPNDVQTTWQAAPGIIYLADWYQVGVEALIPLGKSAGTNVGVIAQFHVFLDDVLPNTLGKPIVEWFE
jgi:hypothetical protein